MKPFSLSSPLQNTNALITKHIFPSQGRISNLDLGRCTKQIRQITGLKMIILFFLLVYKGDNSILLLVYKDDNSILLLVYKDDNSCWQLKRSQSDIQQTYREAYFCLPRMNCLHQEGRSGVTVQPITLKLNIFIGHRSLMY